jgi:DNA-binding NarL/FixJ family response regulator
MPEQIRLASVDDHWAVSAGVHTRLAPFVSLSSNYVQAKTVDELLQHQGPFDVVLLDVRLDDGSVSDDNVHRVVARGWHVLLYTQEPRPAVLTRCLRAGALGIVGKHESPEVLAEAVAIVATGEDYLNADWALTVEAAAYESDPGLSAREIEVVKHYASGLLLSSIARRLGVAEETVKTHLRRARRKYAGVGRSADTQTGLYIRAVQDGYLERPDGT